MNKTLLILALSTSVLPAFSQQDSLLKKFKFRIGHYRAVNFDIGSGNNLDRHGVALGTVKNSSSAGNFAASYYTIKSTDKILLTTTSYLGSNFYTSRSDNSTDVYKYRNFSASQQIIVSNKWFSKNKFIELGANAFINGSSGKSNNQVIPRIEKNKQGQYSMEITAGIGRGRLENITDMQNALWLSKALQTSKSLSQPLSSTELNELGRTITIANNTRVLDARKRTQFILETVDNYLQQKGLINKTDIKYFSNLNDIVFFAFNNPRLSGKEKYIRFTPGISKYGSNQKEGENTTKYERRFNTKSLDLTAGINNYLPQNLTQQNNYGASFKLSYNTFDFADRFFTSGVITNEIKRNPNLKQAGINLFYEHAIYPNTRTSISLIVQTQGGYQDYEKETNFYGSVNVNGTANYFISYRTRFTCSLGAAYQKNMYSIGQYLSFSPDHLQLNANAGINISL